MPIKILLILFFTTICFANLKAEVFERIIDNNDSAKIFVDKIIIFGNEVTREEVIRREMETRENQVMNPEVFKEDIERLYNLGLFNKIDVIPVPLGDNKINLMITVEETFYIIPVPVLNIKESDFKKIQVGANILWRNFAGMNQTLGAGFALGYEPYVNLFYYNPWLGRKNHFFTSFNLSYFKSVNKSIPNFNTPGDLHNKSDIADFDNINFKAEYSIGKFYSKYFSVSAALGYNSIAVSEYQPGRTVSTTGKDKFMTLSLNLNYDRRNNVFYTTYGSYFNAKYIRYNSFNDEISFNKLSFDLRKFVPLKIAKDYNITFSSRGLYSMPFSGSVPVYLHEVLGYDNLIRGWNGKVIDGEYILCSFNELRIPLIKPFYVNGSNHIFLKSLPVFKDISYKYGLYISPFFDIGAVWNRFGDFNKTEFRSGYGLGLDAILPFNIVGRLDFALRNQDSKFYSQFIFALNASF